jgi:copper transport protein
VAVAPAAIRLWFDEAITPGLSSIRLLDRTGAEVETGRLRTIGEPAEVDLALGALKPGVYTVLWKVVSAVDGHPTRGAQVFAVVPPGTTVTEADLRAAREPARWSGGRWILVALRIVATWVHLGALLFLVGGLHFGLVIRPRAPAGAGAAHARVPPGAVPAALLALGSGVVLLQAEWLEAAETTLFHLIHYLIVVPGIPVILGTRSSLATFCRLGLLVAILALLFRARRVAAPRRLLWVALGVAAAALETVSWSSHTAASGGPWAILADWLHLSAAAIWVGGLGSLAAMLLGPGEASPEAARGDARAAMRAFTRWAAGSVAVIMITGVIAAFIHLPDPGALVRTWYGRTLAGKLGLLIPMLLLGGLHALSVRPGAWPALHAAIGRIQGWGERRLRRPGWSVGLEAAIGLGVLLCAAALTQLPPPRDAAIEMPGPLSLAREVEGVRLSATISSPQGWTAPSEVLLAAADREGRPLADVTRVILRPSMPAMEMRVPTAEAVALGDGRYRAEVFFGMRGGWQLDVAIRRQGRDDLQARLPFVLGEGPAVTSGAPRWRLSPAAAWVGQQTRRQLLFAAALAGAGILGGLAAWRWRVPLALLGALGLLGLGGYEGWKAMLVDVTPATYRKNPFPPTPNSLLLGRLLFRQNCAVCHGGDGRGREALRLPVAINLDLTADHMAQHTDGDLYWWISNGVPRTPMPAFGDALGEGERWHLVNYVRSLRDRASGQARGVK